MKSGSKVWMAAFAMAGSVALVAAQGPPPGRPGGLGPGPDGPQWSQGMGPQGRVEGRMGQRGMQMARRGMRMRGGMRGGMGLGRLLRNSEVRERLGISAEQAAKIQSQESAFAKSRIQNRADLRVKRMELRELMEAEKPDRAAIEKKLRALNETQLAAQLSAVDHRLAMQNALTPEQKEKIKQWHQERRQQVMRPDFGPEGRPGPRGPMRRQGPPNPPAPPVE